MKKMLIFPAGSTKACRYAGEFLARAGIDTVDHPTPEVTHLLLDVPSFDAEGKLRGGGDFGELLRRLPKDVTIVGGNLKHTALGTQDAVDLLQNAEYLARNAAITAECALQVAANALESTFADTPALILGWGRIGKCLARLLRAMGCPVTVAARKEGDLAMLRGLGYEAVDIQRLPDRLASFRLLFNTIPAAVLSEDDTKALKNCTLIELASKPGICGGNVIAARGLPGIYAPESSGRLIAEVFQNQCKEGRI